MSEQATQDGLVLPDKQLIDALPDGKLIRRYAIGVEWFDHRVTELADEQLDQAFLPDAGVGRWPIRVLLGHLADAELAFVHRMRRIVAEDAPVLGVFDDQAFIDRGLYAASEKPDARPPPIGAFVAVIYTLRTWTAEWLFSLTDEQRRRKAMHPEVGEQTLRSILEYEVWHLEHHAAYLNAKIARFLGPRPEPEASTGCCAGSGGCGCRETRETGTCCKNESTG